METDLKKTYRSVGPFLLILGIVVFLWKYGGGMGQAAAMIYLIHGCYWRKYRKTLIDEYKYKKLRTAANPLYVRGYFRKGPADPGKKLILAGPKWRYLCELHAVFQMAVIFLYGIVSLWKGENVLWEQALLIWIFAGIFVLFPVDEYYIHILKPYEKNKNLPVDRVWKPFAEFDLDAKKATEFPWEMGDFDEISRAFSNACKKNGYTLWNEFEQKQIKKMKFYIRNRRCETDIFVIAHVEDLSETLFRMDRILRKFFLEYYETDWPKRKICLTAFMYTNGGLSTVVNRKAIQKLGRYYLPVYYSMERESFYISKQDGFWGRRQYREMYDEFMGMLHLLKWDDNRKTDSN